MRDYINEKIEANMTVAEKVFADCVSFGKTLGEDVNEDIYNKALDDDDFVNAVHKADNAYEVKEICLDWLSDN